MAAFAIGACDAGGVESPAPIVRDSAGVTIVENPDPLAADSGGWSVDTTPLLRIGDAENSPHYLFDGISGIARLGTGEVVVALGRLSELRIFDSTGVLVARVGRRGQGPGEFVQLGRVFAYGGDSILAIDRVRGRAALFDRRGTFVRELRLPLPPGVDNPRAAPPRPRGVFADGSVLTAIGSPSPPSPPGWRPSMGPPPPMVTEDTLRFIRVDYGGDTVADFGRAVANRIQYLLIPEGDRASVAIDSRWVPPVFYAARGARFYHADARTMEFRVFASGSAPERIVRAAFEQRRGPSTVPPMPGRKPTTTAESPFARGVREAIARLEIPSRLRAFDSFAVDAEGNMWVKEYTPYWETAPALARWWVFDADGVLRRTVRLPDIEAPVAADGPVSIEIGSDYVLGVGRDSSDVEVLHLYRLRKRDD